MTTGHKHLIKCSCVLSQFKKLNNPPQHQFVVFSVIDENDVVKQKYAQCPNCGIIHKVTEIGKSEIIKNKEVMSSIITINDIKSSLNQSLVSILENNHADIASWEMAQFICENKKWGEFVVLVTESEAQIKQGKYVRILGENLFKVENFSREEEIQ